MRRGEDDGRGAGLRGEALLGLVPDDGADQATEDDRRGAFASSTIPPEMVFATAVDRKAPTMLSTAEMATASFGRSAPVAIDVAMALAVSWNPLVKSNANAVTITRMTTVVTLATLDIDI
jgi:hypothetical protein